MLFENISGFFVSVVVILVLIILGTLKSLFEKRHIFRFARNYGGYKFYPLIGNGHHVIGKNIFTATQEIIDKHGLPCNMWLGHDYNYITADASEIKIILNHPNCFDKMKIYDSLKLGFSNSLLLAPVDVWKRHRKFFSKSFSQPLLNTFVQYFYNKSISLLEVLKTAEHRDSFEIFERYTFDSFCGKLPFAKNTNKNLRSENWTYMYEDLENYRRERNESIIGIDYDLQINPKVKIVEWMGQIQEIGGKRLLTYFYYPTVLWILSSEGRHVLILIKKTKDFIYDIIKQKRKTLPDDPVCVESTKTLPLLDSMLQAGSKKFNDRHIFKEMLLFTTAATDTSGYTLAYIFTLLGMYPEIQEKVYKEVFSVVGCDRPIYYDDLPNLKYTERSILEAMRLLPVTPILGRLATSDIDVGTKVIPKGTNIFISVLNLHRSEKYWPNPLDYNPDRFLPEEVAKREPYTHIPFSGGPRNCIGKTYATMLMKTAVANVIRNYEISSKYKSVTELKLTSCITMKTTHPLDCQFKSRMTNS